MKRLLLVLIASAAFVGPASAADLAPAPSEPPAPVYLPFSWTGFYVGGQLGGAWNDAHWSAPTGAFAPFNTNGSGFLYGGQLGYNYQINQFVVGLEGDFAGSTVKGTTPCPGGFTTCQAKQNWLGSVRARLGYAWDRFLVYADGGVAFSDYKFGVIGGPSVSGGSRTGWTAGLGAEYAFTDHWSAAVEWNYYDFGKKSDFGFAPPVAVRATENTVMAKINYRF